jgi:hypothetical protein
MNLPKHATLEQAYHLLNVRHSDGMGDAAPSWNEVKYAAEPAQPATSTDSSPDQVGGNFPSETGGYHRLI